MRKEEYKLIAPDVNRLVHCYSHAIQNPEQPSAALMEVLDPLFKAMEDLAPFKKNDEAKGIWVMVPRGGITDWRTYEEAREYEEVESKKEYEKLWREYYPFEMEWYFVGISENKPDARWKFRGLSVASREENCLIVNANLNDGVREETWYKEEPAIELCKLLLPAVENSMGMLRDGTYNRFVEKNLPYPYRTGVIKRSAVYAAEPEYKEQEFEGLKPEQIQRYRSLISSGNNDELKIGRLEKMTANDFFRACELGYQAIGKKTEGFTPVQLYLRYADGRDEGLTGKGHGLNEGPGIDFDDPSAWEEWYFGSHDGGHPWEVVPGGNSTHMALFVRHDRHTLEWKVRLGEMTQEEADQHPVGFYYQVTGKHRPMESVSFYLALHDAGLPVLISDAEEILARFDASDYIGIVPHAVTPKYCESMFPEQYGKVIDFMHVYQEDLEKYKNDIIWLPEDPVELKGNLLKSSKRQEECSMSRSFGVKILLPMDKYNSDEVYTADERLEKVSSDKEDGKYYKTLKIRSTYAARTDIRAYLIGKYGLSEEDFRNYSISSGFRDWIYSFGNNREIVLTDAEYESLTREHVDEGTYCLVFRRFSPDVYGSVLYELFGDDEAVIDDDLINKTIDMIGKDYARQNEDREEDEEFSSDRALENIIDYEYSMDGKLLVSLIIGREIAKHIGGIAVAYYE